MLAKCSICSNPDRLLIDRELVSSGNVRATGKKFDLPYNSLNHHANHHISRQMSQALEKKDTAAAFDLLARIDQIINRAEDIFLRNYKKGADGLALKALEAQRSTFELLAKISYSLHQAKQAEIELARINSGENVHDFEAEFAEQTKILTLDELKLLQRLHEKLRTQDAGFVILPPPADSKWANSQPSSPVGNLTQPDDEEEETDVENEPDEYADMRVVPFFPPRRIRTR